MKRSAVRAYERLLERDKTRGYRCGRDYAEMNALAVTAVTVSAVSADLIYAEK
jgi:hypothetical protein